MLVRSLYFFFIFELYRSHGWVRSNDQLISLSLTWSNSYLAAYHERSESCICAFDLKRATQGWNAKVQNSRPASAVAQAIFRLLKSWNSDCLFLKEVNSIYFLWFKVRRYGTTQAPVDQFPRKYVNYTVRPDDTLQGIALKNDCSVSKNVSFVFVICCSIGQFVVSQKNFVPQVL